MKNLKYIPSVILFLLLPILIIFPLWQVTVGFSVFAVFSFFFMREFNIDETNIIQGKLNRLEDDLKLRIVYIEEELKKNQDKTKDLNNSIVGLKMTKQMQPRSM